MSREGSETKSYYQTNPFSKRWRSNLAQMVKDLIGEIDDEAELLDVGVGDGYTARLVKPEGKIYGIDSHADSVQSARERGIFAVVGSAYQVPFPDESYDVVTCLEVLEHLDEPQKAVDEIERVLKLGGIAVLTTPIPNLRWRAIWWLWSSLGPGRRWSRTPHKTDILVEGSRDGRASLQEMLEKRGMVILKKGRCNYGMVTGVLAKKEPDAEVERSSPPGPPGPADA